MTAVAVIQARTGSSRLPGKVLLPINGLPLAVLAAKRAANTGLHVIVATSDEPSDDALVSVLRQHEQAFSRGSLNNTLERITYALTDYEDDTIVFRLTADNIFPDGKFLEEIQQDFIERELDYLSSTGLTSGLPYGVSVEVTRLKHLRHSAIHCVELFNQEHVTPYIRDRFGTHIFTKYQNINMGHYRCTIDCLDDYLLVQRVLSNYDNIVEADLFQLVETLKSTDDQIMVNKPVTKLVVGGAQLGMHYGITNAVGIPDKSSCEILLKKAISNGVEYIDTARAYGHSEAAIGAVLEGGWHSRVKVITKLSVLDDYDLKLADSLANSVKASVYQSCLALRVQSLDVLMLHRAKHLSQWDGVVWTQLLELVAAGTIQSLGVSVQSPEELEQALAVPEVAFIQMPFNILDWRWQESIKMIEAAKNKRSLTIHVRSPLLQGLLASRSPELWQRANVDSPNTTMDWLQSQVEKHEKHNVAELCLSYVNSMSWVDGICVGMESIDQLNNNMNIISTSVISTEGLSDIVADRPIMAEETLNPSLWKQSL